METTMVVEKPDMQGMRSYRMRVADLPFDCILPEVIRIEEVLPSCIPFVQEHPVGDAAFVWEAVPEMEEEATGELLEEFRNDMGKVRLFRNGTIFRIDLSYGEAGTEVHRLWMDKKATWAKAVVSWESPSVRVALISMLRIVFSQRILFEQGFSIHASTVVKEGKSYLFLGKSGTGKSTHSRLWQQVFPGTHLLNDDNPIVRIIDGQIWVYGSPWSGKTPCYRQERAPLQGIVRLVQAPENRWTTRTGVKAWSTVYPSCAVISEDNRLYEQIRKTLNRVVTLVKVGQLECLPNPEAARMCEENMK